MANEFWADAIGVVSSVAGAIGGAWYGAKLSRQGERDLLHDQARVEFANAFAATLARLGRGVEDHGLGEALQIMNEGFPKHYLAYVKLRTALPPDNQRALDAAWNSYTKEHEYELSEEGEFYRFIHVLGPKHDEHQFMLAEKHIYALLAKTAA